MHANSSKSRALAVPQALDMQRAVVMFVNGGWRRRCAPSDHPDLFGAKNRRRSCVSEGVTLSWMLDFCRLMGLRRSP